MDIKSAEKKINELKSFVIDQMKNAEWCENSSNRFKSKYITIDTRTGNVTPTVIKVWDIEIEYNDISISKIRWKFLMKKVKKSSSLSMIRHKKLHLAKRWNEFLTRNKDLDRDNKLNQILD